MDVALADEIFTLVTFRISIRNTFGLPFHIAKLNRTVVLVLFVEDEKLLLMNFREDIVLVRMTRE